jgi:hypothetical protein
MRQNLRHGGPGWIVLFAGETVAQAAPVTCSLPSTSVQCSNGRLVVTTCHDRSYAVAITSNSSSTPVLLAGTYPSSSKIGEQIGATVDRLRDECVLGAETLALVNTSSGRDVAYAEASLWRLDLRSTTQKKERSIYRRFPETASLGFAGEGPLRIGGGSDS